MTYSTKEYSGVTELQSLISRWAELKAAEQRPHQDVNAAWARIRSGDPGCEKLRVVGVLHGEQLVGLAVLNKDQTNSHGWQLNLPGKEVMLARFSMRQATFYGDSLMAPTDLEVQRALLRGIVESCRDCQLIRFNNVDCDSQLYALIVQESWLPFRWKWKPRVSRNRWQIRIEGSFDDYLKSQFSGRRRQKLRHERRRLEEACTHGLRIQVVTAPAEIEEFLHNVRRVVQASWQGKRYPGWLRGSSHHRKVQSQAEQSQFRGYLLSNKDTPIAFVCGALIDGAYSPDRVGFDAQWSQYSPGKHLWLAIIQDLFAAEGVRWMDFGRTDMLYKEFFANHQHSEVPMYLIRNQLRPIIALAPSIVGRTGLKLAGSALRPFGLNTWFDRFIIRLTKGRV